MTPVEIKKLTRFFQGKFQLSSLQVKPRPRKDDSAEVYLGEEFIGVIYRDDEEPDDISYSFSMAILDIDLDEYA